MDAVTYPAKDFVKFVNNYLIPLRMDVSDDLALEDYHHFWTPSIAILAIKGNEVQRTVGFLGVDEFIPSMLLGLGKVRLDAGDYNAAMIPLKSLQETYSKSHAVPEAIYFSGVVLYKNTNDPGKLKQAYEKLLKDYPNSAWTKRAQPYRLLQNSLVIP